MGNGTFTKSDYHTMRGYFTDGYISSPDSVAYRLLLVPVKGFEGPFFYVRELGNGKYEVIGELYEYQKNWKESMQGCRDEIADTVENLRSKGRLGYFFLDKKGRITKKEWAEFHNDRIENEQHWFITDDDCFQCCRIIKPNNAYRPNDDKGPAFDGVYEFVQINRSGPIGTKYTEKHIVSHGIIDMNDYTEAQVVDYLRMFDYKDLLDFLSINNDFSCQLVAEMIFETDWHGFALSGTYANFANACVKVSKITGINANRILS